MLRLNSILASYDASPDKKPTSRQMTRSSATTNEDNCSPKHERPRSIKLKPQEYFLFVIAFVTLSALVIYNVFMSYYNYYKAIDEQNQK